MGKKKTFFDDFPNNFCIFMCLNEGADEKRGQIMCYRHLKVGN